MTFNDIFKSSFLEKASAFSVMDFMIAMALAFALGLFIFWVYKKTFNSDQGTDGYRLFILGDCGRNRIGSRADCACGVRFSVYRRGFMGVY